MIRVKATGLEWNPKLPLNGVRHPRNIAYLWTDEQLNAIGLERYNPPAPDPADPLTLPATLYQLKLAILQSGKAATVKAAIDALPANQKQRVQTRLEYKPAFSRGDPVFTVLGLTEQEMDDIWIAAVAIEE